ncbi:MAG: phosphotransferase [Phycisphaerales bacterium]|nr:MAG: phosphotransferase [Phycisphaerales bacterium]
MSSRERESFDATELPVVLSHYDLGVIESITVFPKGSRRSPKVGIVAGRGKYLLKRRAAARAHPDRVRFAHRVHEHVAAAGVPVAKLIHTRERAWTLVQIRDHIYELFEFVADQPYERSVKEAHDAGVVLGRFHEAMDNFALPETLPTPRGDYHDRAGVRTGLCSISSRLSSHDSLMGNEAELAVLVEFLLGAYDQVAEAVNDLGHSSWPQRVIHSDWHPGNVLFKKRKVVAVLDFDSVRMSRQVLDVANGALQFSIIASGDPFAWPDELDEKRFNAFLTGYGSLRTLSQEERRAIPSLMAEALIAECVHPIAETGSVGRWAGYRVLQMVRRKLTWLESNGDRLISSARG